MKLDPKWIHGKLAEEIFEEVAGDLLKGPIFIKGYPVDTSPLVRAHRERAGITEKWDLYVDGFELATGYSELVDPVIQRERLIEQAKLGAKGDLEAMQLTKLEIEALKQSLRTGSLSPIASDNKREQAEWQDKATKFGLRPTEG
jgi:lysyl-tRNA synthetase class 2